MVWPVIEVLGYHILALTQPAYTKRMVWDRLRVCLKFTYSLYGPQHVLMHYIHA